MGAAERQRGDGPPWGVLVALCGGAHAGPEGLDPGEVRSILEERASGASVTIESDLCLRPGILPELAADRGAARVVLGSCGGGPATVELQAWARRAGLDPFAIDAVDLGLVAATGSVAGRSQRAAALLAAAAAAARASRGTDAAQLRMRLPREAVSRRALLTLGPVTYQPVASIDAVSCVGTERCGLCVSICPKAAIRASTPHPSVASEACVACGACVSVCPAGAIGLPGAGLDRFEVLMATLLSWPWADGARPGLLFACRGATTSLPEPREGEASQADWLPVVVPCLSMVTPGWALQGLARGVPAVALLGCGDRCEAGTEELTRERVTYCLDLLASLGVLEPARRLRFLAPRTTESTSGLDGLPGEALAERSGLGGLSLLEPAATAGALRRLAERPGRGRVVAAGSPAPSPASPLGALTFEDGGCTLCGTCADVCPTSALTFRQDGKTASLAYEGSRCLSCRHCIEVCPEHVLAVEARTDIAAVLAGRTELKRGAVAACGRCGRPVAPAAMVERVRRSLPDEPPELLDLLGEVCLDCRGLWGTGPGTMHIVSREGP